jgi:hypothetical protein
MSRRSLATLLAVLALLGLGVLWLLSTVGTHAATPPAQDAAAPDLASPAKTPAAADLQAGRPDSPIESHDPVAERAAASGTSSAPIPADAIWIQGHVRIPPGTPADEEATVVRLDDSDDARPRPGVPVGADGSFRIAVAKDAEGPMLDVRGRYLYLPEPLELDLSGARSAPADVVLSPKVGGCIRGHLILPRSALDRRASLAGLEIHAEATAEGEVFRGRQVVERIARASESLEFELGGIPPHRSVYLNAQPPRLMEVDRPAPEVAPGRVTELDLQLQVGVRAAGRVVDEKGDPVEGVQISSETSTPHSSATRACEDPTGRDGTFDLPGIPPGKIVLTARKPDWARATAELGALADGSVREGLVLALSRGLSIAGRVEWPDGKPAAGCRIEYSLTPATSAHRRFGSIESRSTRSRADGGFEISGLGADPVRLSADTRGRGMDEPDEESNPSPEPEDSAPSGVAVLEDVAPGTTGLVIKLRPGTEVRGRAIDDQGEPVVGVRVQAQRATGDAPWEMRRSYARGRSVGSDGSFVVAGLQDGAWDVTAEADGHAASSAHRVTVPKDVESFDLVLPRAARLSGTVVDPEGNPVEGAVVRRTKSLQERWMRSPGSSEEEKASTDAKGRFVLDGVAPGPGQVVAAAEGFAEGAPIVIDVRPSEVLADLSLVLRRGGRIVGEVLDDAGRPEGSCRVYVNAMSGDNFFPRSVDSSGHFEFEGLAPGKYWVTSHPLDEGPASGEEGEPDAAAEKRTKMARVVVVEGETTRVVLGGPVQGGVRVHGEITSGGKPLAGCSLWIYRNDNGVGPQSGASDAQGHYEFTLEGPGSYGISLDDRKTGMGFTERFTVPAGAEFEHDIAVPAGRISGRVLGVDGAPAKGAMVSLSPDGRSGELSGSASYGHKESDERGAFAFEGLKGGVYKLEIGSGPWVGQGPKAGTCTRSGVELPEGGHVEGIELRLQATARVEGSVTGPDGAPVAGAVVYARDDQGNLIQRWPRPVTDGSGRFSLDGLTPGAMTFGARTSKLAPVESATVALRAGETSRIVLEVRAGTILRVIVQDGDGTPVGASVRVADDRGRDMGALSQFDLEFLDGPPSPDAGQRIGPLLPGHYRVTATNHDRASASKDVDVSGDEQVVTVKYGG